jgi:hypothetical protein
MLMSLTTVDPLTTTPKGAMIRGQTNKTQNTKGMTTRFTYDIQTQQLVYAIVDKNGVCKYLTTSITDAIKLTQLN